jgi:hypothetical protein
MGLNNWLVQRTLAGEAKRVAEWATKTYRELRGKNPRMPDREVFEKMIISSREGLSPAALRSLDACSQTIEGVCYLTLDMSGFMKGWITFRCLQLTAHVDAALYARGFTRQSLALKERALEVLDLRVPNWQQWTGDE